MNFLGRISLPLGLAVLSTLSAGLAAQAETATATRSATLPELAQASEIALNQSVSEVKAGSTSATSTIGEFETASEYEVSNTQTLSDLSVAPTDLADSSVVTEVTADAAIADATEPTVLEAPTLSSTELQEASTSADDLNASTASETTNTASEQISAPSVAQVPAPDFIERPPANNFVGIGVNFGDDTTFAILGKLALTQFSSYGVSFRPSVLIGDSVGLRLPVTLEARLSTGEDNVDRLIPFFGPGAALTFDDDDTEVDFMLTGGADFLITPQFTATAGLSLLFIDDTDLEFLLGVGYNF